MIRFIKILGYTYDVSYERSREEIGATGNTNLPYQMIWIANDVPDEQKQVALVHEIIEVINSALELGLDHTQIQALSIAQATAVWPMLSDVKGG